MHDRYKQNFDRLNHAGKIGSEFELIAPYEFTDEEKYSKL